MKAERILILCAHPDDQIIGVGGTIAKYVKEGKSVRVVEFSSGQRSVPWLKEEVMKRKRKKESKRVAKKLNFKIENLGIPDLEIKNRAKDKKFIKKIKKIISKFKPTKIFTHSRYDLHPDHRAVYDSVFKALEGRKRRPKVLTFTVWSLFNPKDSAKFYVDITKTYNSKINSFKAFKTQRLVFLLFTLPIYIKARLAGIRNNCKFAEMFYVE